LLTLLASIKVEVSAACPNKQRMGTNPRVKKEPKEQWNFRCARSIKDEFEAHVKALHWSVPDTLEALIEAANVLFRGKANPVRPFVVVDAVDDDGSESQPTAKELAELRAHMDAQFAEHSKLVRQLTADHLAEVKTLANPSQDAGQSALERLKQPRRSTHGRAT
jgi:hypothetical protein